MSRELRRVPLDFDEWILDNAKKAGREPPKGEGYQIWETVSDGSPCTPVFRTKEDVVEHLHFKGAGGTFAPCSRAAARAFVEVGFAPTTLLTALPDGRKVMCDGINAFTPQHPLLRSFDQVHDSLLDHSSDIQGTEHDGNLALIRDRLSKLLTLFREFGRLHCAVEDEIEKGAELPRAVKDASEHATKCRAELYPGGE